ncbi:hypothetical protein BV898_10276 [Hypsibius exemplaris]|uniref:Uncharacterized protein n=1 Tax=Hypsibius exemplaris TaxID=2072580 RepID=A0A1W0WK36_HYPEX|nr:hypothetical protein BV898_10276 [Hypsibius exemplaris]
MSSTKNNKRKSVVQERHPRELRIDFVEILVQDGLNVPYLDPKTKDSKIFRFNVGSPVVAPCEYAGLYYSATLALYDGLCVPDSLYPLGTVLPVQKRIPTTIVHFDGWTKKYDACIPENELFTALYPGRPVDTLALLMAHEHNLVRSAQSKIKETKLGANAFLLTDEMYEEMERSWQRDTGESISFGQYVGRLPGPYFSNKPI